MIVAALSLSTIKNMAFDFMINQILLCFKQGSTVQDTVIQTESFHKIMHKVNQERLHTVIVIFIQI